MDLWISGQQAESPLHFHPAFKDKTLSFKEKTRIQCAPTLQNRTLNTYQYNKAETDEISHLYSHIHDIRSAFDTRPYFGTGTGKGGR
jgi:hypothetical protein